MKSNFEAALECVLKSEGGFVNDPKDSGGMTNLGVTKRTWEEWVGHPVDEKIMRNLKPEYVAPMYKKKFWDSCGCDNLAKGLDYVVFDFAVNAGPGRSVKTLQSTIGCVPDGIIGAKTLAAINASNIEKLIKSFSLAKSAYYKTLKTYPVFGKGWENRIGEVEKLALFMIGTSEAH